MGTIINRIIRLGYDPKLILCPDEMRYKKATIEFDTRNSDPADKCDMIEVTGYSVYLDMLYLYSNLRKSAKEDSYTLDYIGAKIVGEHKDKVEGDIKTFHLVDYRKFLLYNIQDTVLLLQIDDKLKDTDLFYKIASLTETRITHALKKTVCLRNLADKFYRERGLVISNNRAKIWPKTGQKAKGALAA